MMAFFSGVERDNTGALARTRLGRGRSRGLLSAGSRWETV